MKRHPSSWTLAIACCAATLLGLLALSSAPGEEQAEAAPPPVVAGDGSTSPTGLRQADQPVRVVRRVEYASAGERPLFMDLYLPRDAIFRTPVVIFIHGGAWLGGSRENPPGRFLQNHGYALASISYRFSHMATFPAQLHDCKAAIRYLRAHASQYNIDPDRIAVWGESAGGHLASMLGTTGGVEELEGPLAWGARSSRVQAVINFFGPTDMLRMNDFPTSMDHDAPNSPASRFIGGPIQEHPDKVAAANPITYVTADDPPFLIMHGEKDTLVHINQSELLYEALKEAGVTVSFHRVADAGHGFGRWNADINAKVLEFLDTHLKAE